MSYQVPFAVTDLSYARALEELHATLKFGIQPMLETVVDMLAECGDPDLCYDCVQVAGTNGKTSTSRYTAAILAGEGLRTALYTSPELVSYTERMEVGGRPVSEEAFAHGLTVAIEAGRRVNERRGAAGERPYDVTEFDLLTVAALVVYAEAGIDVVVLEVGMGGRWDATSAAKSIRSVAVTGVGLDHMRILGDTLEAISGEKAAVIQAGRTCVLGVGTATPESVEDVFLGQCAREGVEPVLLRPERLGDAEGEMHPGTPRAHEGMPHASYVITKRPQGIGSALELDVVTPRQAYRGLAAPKPSYQAANIACAVVLSEQFLGRELDQGALRESVAGCPTPGRFDVVRQDPVALIDACHNPQSVETFLTAVRAIAPEVSRRPALLAAVLADKDVPGIVALLALEFPRVYVTQTSSPRALAAAELAEEFTRAGAEVAGVYGTVDEAVEALAYVPYVACGSITLAGEVAGILRP
ncbi:MAG: bifunctional folylpolyglutamate synthase/dihydrofolate synthase [Atopobiaceae bacterium]|nr:bifunctional folylpolyglutamate synthase/dihydrofolate synthase [Atopobiaceae bacterium]